MSRTMIAILLIALAGCSTRTVVHDVPAGQADIKGIPFRVSVEQDLMVYRLKDDADEYELVSVTRKQFVDMSRLYSINFKGDTFASRSLKVGHYPDNTLKSMQLVSTDATPATIEAVSGAISGVNTAEATRKTTALTNAKAVVDADKAVRDAQKDLDALPPGTSEETRGIYQRILDSAKQQAAAARAAAGV